MKCFVAVLLLALFAVAMAEKVPDVEKVDPAKGQQQPDDTARGKRGIVVGTYAAPVAYSSYSSPLAYAGYGLPYAYSAYSAYPTYRYNPYYYGTPYIYG